MDVGSAKVAIGCLGPATSSAQTVHIGTPPGARRLELLHRETGRLAERLSRLFPPVAVIVEQPVGRFAQPGLMMATGVVAAALSEALGELYEHPVSVVFLTPPVWKKRAVGAGNAGKPMLMEFARTLGYEGADQDAADALCIAAAADRGLLAA